MSHKLGKANLAKIFKALPLCESSLQCYECINDNNTRAIIMRPLACSYFSYVGISGWSLAPPGTPDHHHHHHCLHHAMLHLPHLPAACLLQPHPAGAAMPLLALQPTEQR